MPDLETILQSEYAHQVFQGIRDHIFETKCGHLEEFESYSKRLTDGERYVVLVNSFIWENTNGGLNQFLTNDNLIEETRQAMHAINAATAATALDEVRSIVFNNKPIPADGNIRCDILLAW